jgi:hypothetical protein
MTITIPGTTVEHARCDSIDSQMKALALFSLASVMSLCAQSRDLDIRKAHEAFASCWDNRDVACLDKMITADFIDVARTARMLNRREFLDGMKDGRFSKGFPLPAGALIRSYGQTAVVTYETKEPGPRASGNVPTPHVFTLIWVNEDGKNWRLASLHVSMPPTVQPNVPVGQPQSK